MSYEDSGDEAIMSRKEMEDESMKTMQRKQPDTEKPNLKKPKIITIENTSIELIKTFLLNIQVKDKCNLIKRRDNQVQIQCHCNEDKQAILTKLKE